MKFVAFERAKQGTGASRRLRNSGRTPGIVYGGMGKEPVAIELDHNFLWHAIKKEAFHASVLEMEIDGQVTPVLLRDLQMHPFKQMVLHADFQRVDANTRMHKKVPLHFINADQSPAVKADKCLVNTHMTVVEIECLATALPEFITVDLGKMTKGTSLHIKDLVLPAGIKAVTHGRPNQTVASMVEPEPEVVAAPVAKVDDKKKGKGKK